MSVEFLNVHVVDNRGQTGPETNVKITLNSLAISPEFRERYRSPDQLQADYEAGEVEDRSEILAKILKLPTPERLTTPLQMLSLKVRTVNGLEESGILTVGDLLRQEPESLLEIRNFGVKTYLEIEAALAEIGFTIKSLKVGLPRALSA